MTSHLYFNEDSEYSERNPSENDAFSLTILRHKKKITIFTSELPIYYM